MDKINSNESNYIFIYKTGEVKLFLGQVTTFHLKMVGRELETIIIPCCMREYRSGVWVIIKEVDNG